MKIDGIQMGAQVNTPALSIGQGSQDKTNAMGQREVEPLPLEKPVNEDYLNKAIEKANKSFQTFDRRFEVSVHDRLNTIMVKVIDSTNDQVIREIPPQKLLDMVANMLEVAGVLIDKKI